MRIAIIGAGGAHKTEASLARAAISLGHAARVFDVTGWSRRLGTPGIELKRRLVERFQPDFLLFTRHAIRLGTETLQQLIVGRSAAFWYFDLAPTPPPDVVALGKAAGVLYITCPQQMPAYRAAGIPEVRFLPQAADPIGDRPAPNAPARYRCDVSFVGSGQYAHRHQLLSRISDVASLQIRGRNWDGINGLQAIGGPVYGPRFARVVRGASISLGIHAFAEQDRQAMCASNRMWKILACGGFYLGPRVEGIETFARDGEHCAWYESDAEAVSLVERYLAAPEERRMIAEVGHRHALACHTYAHRIRKLLAGESFPTGDPRPVKRSDSFETRTPGAR
ncbi:MAG: CgeB family protein [Gemmatimonadales bacterium]